ncbi:MAG: YkgJ family cysteine cluster protein [Halieaceae bacterium]|jgi:Fe-S-cluster containining protein|nr:YkgJ family cysteine cluster protein [Halieaceae bacterium]
MECRAGCGACCIAASIQQPLPGMPRGKPAGVPCVNLDPTSRRCRIWGQEDYPSVCRRFTPEPAVCGNQRDEALQLISAMEIATC